MTFASDVDGFEFETGRDYNGERLVSEPDETAIVPGDLIVANDGSGEKEYRVVEIDPDTILGFGPTGSHEDSSLELIRWDDVTLKWDPREKELFEHEELPNQIKLVRDPSED